VSSVDIIGSDTFRRVMGHFVTGVTVVSAFDGELPFGITVNALSSVSLDPSLVMVALDRRRFLTPIVRAAGRYAVNILSEDQQALSDCFAGAPVELGRDRFCGAAWHRGRTGLPYSLPQAIPAGRWLCWISRTETPITTPGALARCTSGALWMRHQTPAGSSR
jgi:flavin reductase (DIM6/NTAB) family NADH-FMN oxidoreductase RutF